MPASSAPSHHGAAQPHARAVEPRDAHAVIDRTSHLPYYHQLKHLLLLRVDAEGLAGGDRFWSEHELCAEYGLSRSVVRQALSELEAEGIIERRRGRGTFLADVRAEHGLAQTSGGLHDVARIRGLRLTSRVLRHDVVPASDVIAARLECGPATPVIRIERVRSLDAIACVHTTTWLPAARFPGLDAVDLTDASLYEVLRGRHATSFGRAHRSVEAALPSAETAHLLGIDRGAPVLVLRSTQRDGLGVPFETYVAHHRGDRSRFDLDISAAIDPSSIHVG